MTRGALALLAAIALLTACSSGGSAKSSAPAASTPGTTAAPTTSTTAPFAGYHSDVYATPDHWLCRPELTTDPCHTNHDVTTVRADGTTEVVPQKAAADPGIDCFYVYPTLDLSTAGNASRDDEPSGLEVAAAQHQAGPFGSVCRVFVPRYRQVTLGAYNRPEAHAIALADVVDAFNHYMANDNGGRGVVLIGHSQGAMVLVKLMKQLIDRDPAVRDHFVSALLLGGNVHVADANGAGADFAHIPVCTTRTQTGCMVGYSSFRSTAPPPPNAYFGRVSTGAGKIMCANPAALGGGAHDLDLIVPGTARVYTSTPPAPITTGEIALPGLVSGGCVERNGANYLEVTVHGDPTGSRIDDIGGDLTPPWGLHNDDVALTLGDMTHLVGIEGHAWKKQH